MKKDRKKLDQKKQNRQPAKGGAVAQEDKKGRMTRTVIVLFFTVVFALLAVQWIEQERILARQRDRITDMTAQYEALSSEIEDINREIELASTSSYIERYLREKLGMIKKGEIIYKVNITED